jgi:hypothetical protein
VTSIYDTTPLRHTLAELVDPARLDADTPRDQRCHGRDRVVPQRPTRRAHLRARGRERKSPAELPDDPIGRNWYWDGGLFSDTPLSPAINALEATANGDRAVERELIVVELFPMKAPVPRTLPEVLRRVLLQYTSRSCSTATSSTR